MKSCVVSIRLGVRLYMNTVTECFTCMYVSVFLHVRLLMKAFPTVLARVGSRVAVNEQVRGQGRRPLELLATEVALETSLLPVNRDAMLVHCDAAAERLGAEAALQRTGRPLETPGLR